MVKFNQALYDEAISDFNRTVKLNQEFLSEKLEKLEMKLTNEYWKDFVSNGSKQIRAHALERLNSGNSIYSATPNSSPVERILSEIVNLYSTMVESYYRPSNKAQLIPLAACDAQLVISEQALNGLKVHCTDTMDDKLYRSLEKFIKAYNEVNQLSPKSIDLDCRYLVFAQDGKLEITFNNL